MKELSVTEYAKLLDMTRQGVLSQIKQGRLPENVSSKRIGNAWILELSEQSTQQEVKLRK